MVYIHCNRSMVGCKSSNNYHYWQCRNMQ